MCVIINEDIKIGRCQICGKEVKVLVHFCSGKVAESICISRDRRHRL